MIEYFNILNYKFIDEMFLKLSPLLEADASKLIKEYFNDFNPKILDNI